MFEPSDLWEFCAWLCRGLGAIIASAVYLSGCIAYGNAFGHPFVTKMALAAAGATFLGYLLQMAAASGSSVVWGLAQAVTWGSVLFGAIAGILILAS